MIFLTSLHLSQYLILYNIFLQTREERKLDAIMKAFEKMEKREERRKEAMARGDAGPKKCSGDAKVKKVKTWCMEIVCSLTIM